MVAATCTGLNEIATRHLYRRMMLVRDDDGVELRQFYGTGCSLLLQRRLCLFLKWTTSRAIRYIADFDVLSQPPAKSLEDLYAKFYDILDSCDHPIRFLVHHPDSLYQLLNQFVAQRLYRYNPDECAYVLVNNKTERLLYWNIQSPFDWESALASRCASCIEFCVPETAMPWSLNLSRTKSLGNLSRVVLHTPRSLEMFLEGTYALDNALRLKSLLLTYCHVIGNPHALLKFGALSRAVVLDSLTELELKVSCLSDGCDCITLFFDDWIAANGGRGCDVCVLNLVDNAPRLSLFAPSQVAALFENAQFYKLFCKVQQFYIDMRRFAPCVDSSSSDKLCTTRPNTLIMHMRDLEQLTMPFLLTHRVSLDILLSQFDALVNICGCIECDMARCTLFCTHPATTCGVKKAEYTKTNIERLVEFIVTCSRRITSTRLKCDPMKRPRVVDKKPHEKSLSTLMMHSVMGEVATLIFASTSALRRVNLGGIEVHSGEIQCRLYE